MQFLADFHVHSKYSRATARNLDLEHLYVAAQKIGNICSDGRPILGLDVRDLLESVLETETDVFIVPAHIWAPWFSLLGAKSGFDSIEDENVSGRPGHQTGG